MRISYLIVFLVLTGISLNAQPVNDECTTAIHLAETDNWCSDAEEYTNVNGTPFSNPPAPVGNCPLVYDNEVWFTFIPQTPAMYFKISGAVNGLGTLRNPAIAIFEGPCNTLKRVGCNVTSSITNQVELSIESLVIGKVYFLMVEGQNGFSGTFQICMDGFIPPPNPQSDCSKAVVLCDKSEFVVDTLLGTGAVDPGVSNTCIIQEFSSAWYKWTCEVSGTLTFDLIPNNYQQGFESDDIDFVVYELPGGLDDCANKQPVRCMASGANTNQNGVEPFPSWARCNGPTGLRNGEPDVIEVSGCRNAGQNNFVNALDMVAGKSYALLVNNFSQSGLGFSIEWGGTGTFKGPEPAFDVTAVQAFECDKTIIFENESIATTDSIVHYQWNFGAGADPLSDTTTGPISVVYESFGPKKVALTVTSSKGCVVTEILDFYVEPCCQDTSTLDVTANIQHQICPGTATGVIQGVGISGSPDYQFSLDCITYQPASVFPALLPGEYTLCIQDQKGCENQVELTVLPATGFAVEAGDTIFIELGDNAELNAVAIPNIPDSVIWTHNGQVISNTLDATVLPKTTGWYVVTIINEDGCATSDSVLIVVDAYKPIYIPNVISANQDDVNDRVTVYGNKAAKAFGVLQFQIFDRWGGLLWERTNFELNDPSLGWDGTVDGEPVNPAVYTYMVVVDFLDDIPLTFHGTVTVLR